jgi:hypothetical protein
MGNHNSLEFYIELICTLRNDCVHSDTSRREVGHDLNKIKSRAISEGLSFFTKTLPALGKAVDSALASGDPIAFSGLKARDGVPKLFGDLLRRIFGCDGRPRSDACTISIRYVRQLMYTLYKLDQPYDSEQCSKVLNQFVETEREIATSFIDGRDPIIKRARGLVSRVFQTLDSSRAWDNIIPRHGPGAVATGERGDGKYQFRRIVRSLERRFPFWEYFVTGVNHVAHSYGSGHPLDEVETGTAKVVLVPKDSRGPRLISCEPVEIQWIQQGLMSLMVSQIESHPLTRGRVNFTDQSINRGLALESSKTREFVTLDMKDASDRVSLDLVKALFSGTSLLDALLASRSSATLLPDGRIVQLAKFAPMGSAVCFPVEALCFWALAVASIQLTNGRSARSVPPVYVYGDDVICPTVDYRVVMTQLERFHLKWNLSKCCTHGFFRESCGMDAYKGIPVTPLRFKKRLTSSRDSGQYKSLLSFANHAEREGYFGVAQMCRKTLIDMFGHVGHTSNWEYADRFVYRSSASEVDFVLPKRRRFCKSLHVEQAWTLVPKPKREKHLDSGWAAGLRSIVSQRPAQSDHYAAQRSVKLRGSWVNYSRS